MKLLRYILYCGLNLLAVMVRAEAPAKPNILFILVDDYGIKDVGVEGSSFYETPNIDALARNGMRFTQGYAASPVCSPSHAFPGCNQMNGQTPANLTVLRSRIHYYYGKGPKK